MTVAGRPRKEVMDITSWFAGFVPDIRIKDVSRRWALVWGSCTVFGVPLDFS